MKDHTVTFAKSGTWKVVEKLTEKERSASNSSERKDWLPSEAHAVYTCTKVEGSHVGQKAILKLRIQLVKRSGCVIHSWPTDPIPRIPCDYPPPHDCQEGAKYAQRNDYHISTRDEIVALKRLTKAQCPAAPKLLDIKEGIQNKPMLRSGWTGKEEIWVPGGYVVWILMEKLPGVDLAEFFMPGKHSPQERQEIREAFRKARV